MKKLFRNPLFWIICLSLLPVLSLFHPGMPFVHDGQDHVARIANFYAVLKEGILIPRWGANLNWGYGHPVLMFLYPLPEYVASLFHFIGFSLVDSTKLVFGLAFIASGVAMYLWMSTAFTVNAGIVGSLLYIFAPYRFVDLHVRGALGEHVAFIFVPLVLYFLKKRSYFAFSVSLAALVLSHNAIALMFLPIIILYTLYEKQLFTIRFQLFTILAFCLSSFFWIPALLEGKFTLRDIVTAGEAVQRFVPWISLLYSPWNWGGGAEFSKALGISQWIGVIAAMAFFINTKDKKLKILVSGLLVLLLISFGMMTSWSAPIWRAITILQNFQFPWRFLSLSTFLAAALGGIAFARTKKLFLICPARHRYAQALAGGYSLFIIVITILMWAPKGYQIRNASFYSGIYPGTTDTGESSPVWSTRFMEHTPKSHLEVVDGEATITEISRTTTKHEYLLEVQKPTLMLENTVYFPGWKIYLNDKPTDIQFQNPNYRGLMTFYVTPGTIRVRAVFEDTKVRRIANLISVVSLGVWLLCLLLWPFITKRKI